MNRRRSNPHWFAPGSVVHVVDSGLNSDAAICFVAPCLFCGKAGGRPAKVRRTAWRAQRYGFSVRGIDVARFDLHQGFQPWSKAGSGTNDPHRSHRPSPASHANTGAATSRASVSLPPPPASKPPLPLSPTTWHRWTASSPSDLTPRCPWSGKLPSISSRRAENAFVQLCCCWSAARLAVSTPTDTRWPRWSNSFTPPPCSTTTWWTSPPCAAGGVDADRKLSHFLM